MGVDVVYLAPIGRHVAVWPGADKVFCGGHDELLQRGKPGLVEIDGSGGGVKETSVEVLAQCSGKRGVDKFCPGHGGAIGEADDDLVAVAARYFREIIESDGNHGAVFRAQYATATLDSFPERF